MKVLIACQCATNKGDRAIAEFLIQNLKKGGYEVFLSTTQPKLWNSYKDINILGPGYKTLYNDNQPGIIRKFLILFQRYFFDKILFTSLINRKRHRICNLVSKEFIKITKQMDLVIVTGGHHLTTIREKNALFSFTYDMGLISLYSNRYFLWSQTIGPLEFKSKRAKEFFLNLLKKSERVFIRDENSFEALKTFKYSFENLKKTYDTVFGFGYLLSDDGFRSIEKEKKVGISIFNGLKKSYKTFEILAKLLDYIVINGYMIEFFRMEYNEEEMESINKIVSFMKGEKNYSIYPFLTSTEDHLREMKSCDLFIGYKTHSVIMSLTAAIPILAIAYHKKTIDFMKDYNMEKFSIEDESINYEALVELFNNIVLNKTTIISNETRLSQLFAEKVKADLQGSIKNE